MSSAPTLPDPTPVAVGGVGGSGTRLVARMLAELGFFLGGDLNESYDNLWFTLLFKRREILKAPDEEIAELVEVFRHAMSGTGPLSPARIDLAWSLAATGRPAHDAEWLQRRAWSLEVQGGERKAKGAWGWKEPNTHVVLPRLELLLPGMKYIHVIRNGLDMAYSSNQSQLLLWGPSLLGVEKIDPCPRLSLRYWHAVHSRVLEHGRTMAGRFLLLSYDKLCADPGKGLKELLDFLDVEPDRATREHLLASIRPPRSMGRFRRHAPSDFDREDVAFARELGFDADY